MRADERQAAIAYTYAWWLTGDDEAASTAVRTAIMGPPPAVDEPGEVSLARRVRQHIGDVQAMPPSSEMTLLHDGLDIDLQAAAEIAGVADEDISAGLAHGRFEALLETVRDDFEHPDRIGGLAIGDAGDMAHARQCPSCARARTLLERGRTELREVVSVSAPPGLLRQLVAEAAAAASADADVVAPPAAEAEDAKTEAEADVEAEDRPAADVAPETEPPAADEDTEIVLDEPADAPVDQRPPVKQDAAVEHDTVIDLTEAPPRPKEHKERRIATTPAKRRTAGVLVAAGILTASLLVAVMTTSATDPTTDPSADQRPDPGGEPTENPAMEEPTDEPSAAPPNGSEGPPQGPPAESPREFRVVQTGIILPGEDSPAASGAEVGPNDLIRVAVDYEGATEGVQLTAIWRVDEEEFDRLEALVSSSASRHVWGVTPPEGGWPPGAHRIVLTADDAVTGAVDFTVADR